MLTHDINLNKIDLILNNIIFLLTWSRYSLQNKIIAHHEIHCISRSLINLNITSITYKIIELCIMRFIWY